MDSEISVFHATINQFTPELIEHVPVHEHQHLQRFTHTKRKQFFILGRTILAQSLEFLGEQNNYEICYLPLGKPILEQPQHCFFNITHSGEHLLLALCKGNDIGIDSEIIKPRNYQTIAQKKFSKEQQQAIEQSQTPLITFYQYWTQFEARIKCQGLSVFNTLSNENHKHLMSFQHEQLIYSLCAEKEITKTHFYHFTGITPNNFKKIDMHRMTP